MSGLLESWAELVVCGAAAAGESSGCEIYVSNRRWHKVKVAQSTWAL